MKDTGYDKGTTVYNKNETMKMLLDVDYGSILDKEALKMLDDIAEARPNKIPKILVIEIFLIGYTHRKNQENNVCKTRENT